MAAIQKPQDTLEAIKAGIGDLSSFEVFGNQVLVGIWIRPEQTKAGLFLPEQNRMEDTYQGKTGFVLKRGPLAFVSDNRVDFGNDNVSEGDLVVYRTSDGFPIDINKVHCRLLEDVHIKARISDPAIVW